MNMNLKRTRIIIIKLFVHLTLQTTLKYALDGFRPGIVNRCLLLLGIIIVLVMPFLRGI